MMEIRTQRVLMDMSEGTTAMRNRLISGQDMNNRFEQNVLFFQEENPPSPRTTDSQPTTTEKPTTSFKSTATNNNKTQKKHA